MPLLDYPAQVAELEKIARLSPPRAVRRAPPELGAAGAGECLVCGARPARPCGACGGVFYCSEEHQRVDACWHDAACEALRAIAEDAALAASGPREALIAELRARPAGPVPDNWDMFLGAGPETARRRLLTDLATRPLTLARALAALDVRVGARVAIHVMGAARREREVAPELWAELGRWFPGSRFELALVGPELVPGPDVACGPVALRLRRGVYGRELWGELGRPDLVIGYDCGLLMYPAWKPTILGLRGSGAPFVITSYREWEAAGEARVLAAVGAARLLAPAANPFASLAGKRSTTVANDVAYDNAYVGAWR
jgi:hypothetical protein